MNNMANFQLGDTASWLASFDASLFEHAGGDWLLDRRQQALEQFEHGGLPGVRDEDWRYTNLRTLKSRELGFANAPDAAALTAATALLPATDHPRLVLVNGYPSAELSSLASLEGGVELASLQTAMVNFSAEIEVVFGAALPAQQHGFSLLNTAWANDGFVLRLSANQVVEQALEVCFVSTTGSMSHNRNLIIAGVHSQCQIIERHIGVGDSAYLNNSVTEIYAADGAHVDHYKLVDEAPNATHVGGVFIRQAANSQVRNHQMSLGGALLRNDVLGDLLGQGAYLEMNGLVLGDSDQHIDNFTQVNHQVPNCNSDEYYKTILDQQARSVFRGRIVVAEDAQQTNADQRNNNLLLSPRAEADTKPQLEIYADDVKCSHGATVGQLDPKSLFYLQSRGIDSASAHALLTYAFANEVIDRIRIDSLRGELSERIAGRLLSDLEELL